YANSGGVFFMYHYSGSLQTQQFIREQNLSILQNRLTNDISNKNITFPDISRTIIFTRHIKNFTIVKIN
ncbi:hypothetical protein, partial [Bacillus pacificus]|uniref:hypothetical protein n=1 Tax=Bacillus pacificus TaxID=2026187 RepID=UPI001E57534D